MFCFLWCDAWFARFSHGIYVLLTFSSPSDTTRYAQQPPTTLPPVPRPVRAQHRPLARFAHIVCFSVGLVLHRLLCRYLLASFFTDTTHPPYSVSSIASNNPPSRSTSRSRAAPA